MIKYILLISSLAFASGQGVLTPPCPDSCAARYNDGGEAVDICPRDPSCRSYCDWCNGIEYVCPDICSYKAAPCKFDQCSTCDYCLNRTPVKIDLGSMFNSFFTKVVPQHETPLCTEHSNVDYSICIETGQSEDVCNANADETDEHCADCNRQATEEMGDCQLGCDHSVYSEIMTKCMEKRPHYNCKEKGMRAFKKCMNDDKTKEECRKMAHDVVKKCRSNKEKNTR